MDKYWYIQGYDTDDQLKITGNTIKESIVDVTIEAVLTSFKIDFDFISEWSLEFVQEKVVLTIHYEKSEVTYTTIFFIEADSADIFGE